jgi:hypothetical protein
MWTSAEAAQEFLRVNAFDLGGQLGQRGSGAIIPRLAPDGKLPSRALLRSSASTAIESRNPGL